MPAIVEPPHRRTTAVGGSVERLLVTGAAGFLGSELVRQGIAAGHDVYATIRPGSDGARLAGLPCTIRPTDLRDPGDVERLIRSVGPSLVINAAAAPGHASTASDRLDAWADNTMATVHLLEALHDAPHAVLVHVGAGTEYGPSPQPMREDDSSLPLTLRGVTKRAATMAVRHWASTFDRPAVVVRPFSIYGPGEQPHKLVPTLLRCAERGEVFPMLADVSRRDLVHVGDVADGCVRAAAVAGSDTPVVNLGTGVEYTVDDVRRIVEEVTGRPIATSPGRRATQTHDVEHWVADTSTCRRLLGWVPTTSLRDGIAGLVSWHADESDRVASDRDAR